MEYLFSVPPTTISDYENAGYYLAMLLRKETWDALKITTQEKLELWKKWEETYAVIARTNAAGEIISASGDNA